LYQKPQKMGWYAKIRRVLYHGFGRLKSLREKIWRFLRITIKNIRRLYIGGECGMMKNTTPARYKGRFCCVSAKAEVTKQFACPGGCRMPGGCVPLRQRGAAGVSP